MRQLYEVQINSTLPERWKHHNLQSSLDAARRSADLLNQDYYQTRIRLCEISGARRKNCVVVETSRGRMQNGVKISL